SAAQRAAGLPERLPLRGAAYRARHAGELVCPARQPPGGPHAAWIARAPRRAASDHRRGAPPARPGRVVAGALPAKRRQGGPGPPEARGRGGLPPLQALAVLTRAGRWTGGDPVRLRAAPAPVRAGADRRPREG